MPKMIDPELKARAVRLVTEHVSEYPSLTAAVAAVAKQLGVGKESVRRWVIQAQVDTGERDGITTEEQAEVKRLKAENRRLREDVAILRAATTGLLRIWLTPRPHDPWKGVVLEGWQSCRRSFTPTSSSATRSRLSPQASRRSRSPGTWGWPRPRCSHGSVTPGSSPTG